MDATVRVGRALYTTPSSSSSCEYILQGYHIYLGEACTVHCPLLVVIQHSMLMDCIGLDTHHRYFVNGHGA